MTSVFRLLAIAIPPKLMSIELELHLEIYDDERFGPASNARQWQHTIKQRLEHIRTKRDHLDHRA
jgi:hypothetical protein